MNLNARPKLRLLETHPYDQHGQSGVLLIDPDGLFDGQVFVPDGLLPVVACFTGESTVDEIARELTERYEQAIFPEEVRRVAEDLDSRLCLEGPAAESARADRRAAFDALAARPPTHAGSAGYPLETGACASRLAEVVGNSFEQDPRPIAGLIAPHIDLQRGAAGYRAAYRALAAAPPADLYVLFGTSHQSPRTILVPTTKHFDTPIGRVETDVAFVHAVAQRLGGDPFEEELLHLGEHSLEFQVLFLAYCLGEHPFKIAPFLTGILPPDPDGCQRTGRIVGAILDEVRHRGDARVTFVGGADMAHLGPWFGDPEPVGHELLSDLDARDRESLEHLLALRTGDFHADVERDGNARRICGTTPMYLVTRLARELNGGCAGELLDYGQAIAPDGSQVVTHASVVFRGE